MLFPINFSIPKEKIVNEIPNKTKLLSNLIPGDISTYIYNTEKDYYDEYKKSYFAITKKKAGWDCMRHYEIMANGCIPYFIDIENSPENTMKLLPKELFIESNKLYEKLKHKNINELTEENKIECNNLIQKLLDYTKNKLTTIKISEYILNKTNHSEAKKILFLSGCIEPDYMRCLTLHGFKELIGSNCHDYPKITHLYKFNNSINNNLYGKGFTYSYLLDNNIHDIDMDKNIEELIKNKYYDIIIYGSYHRGMPYYDLVNNIYEAEKIILLCGEDIHICNYYKYLNKGHHIFVREL